MATMNAPDPAGACLDSHVVDIGFVNLSWAQVAVLGIVQGVTELQPISSTAHLRVLPGLLGWPDPGSAFSAAMQLASFAAVVVYFRRDILNLAGAGVGAGAQRDYRAPECRMLLGILLGTLPLLLVGALLRPVLNGCHSPLRGLLVIGCASIVMSLLLAVLERMARHIRGFGAITLRDGLIDGAAQTLELISGVSRSGATLTAALFYGMERETAARFSFLLGLPAITIAGLFELRVLFDGRGAQRRRPPFWPQSTETGSIWRPAALVLAGVPLVHVARPALRDTKSTAVAAIFMV
jgi:undecaprenyl-diphosphatase